MKKQQNSKTQSEAEAELAAQRAIDPNAGNDPNPPAVAADAQKRTRKNRPVVLYREAQATIDGETKSVLVRECPGEFATEGNGWDWVKAQCRSGEIHAMIDLDKKTWRKVETVVAE